LKLLFDASAATPLLIEEPGSAVALELWKTASERLGLDVTLIEINNAIWHKHRNHQIMRPAALVAHEACTSLFDRVLNSSNILKEAMAMAMKIGYPVPDCLNAVACLKYHATLVTTDRAFATKLRGTGVELQFVPG
jgi:predicted nucleic acid-binding protein